jgi:hypothetical protein
MIAVQRIAFFRLLMLSVARSGAAQTPPAAMEPISVTATIEAIDKGQRLITLKGPKGNLVTVKADESVKRFDELKVGDQVTAKYYESVAAHIRRPGDPPPKPVDTAITPRQGGPGATLAAQETVTVTVQGIDKANRSVTVKKQNGDVVSFRVQNPKYLEIAKVGDTVDVTYTQALLIEATRATK